MPIHEQRVRRGVTERAEHFVFNDKGYRTKRGSGHANPDRRGRQPGFRRVRAELPKDARATLWCDSADFVMGHSFVNHFEAMVCLGISERSSETARARLQTAFELLDVAERMLRRRLIRDNPGLSDEAFEERVAAWYRRRPGAEQGDGVGVVSTWPRRRTP